MDSKVHLRELVGPTPDPRSPVTTTGPAPWEGLLSGAVAGPRVWERPKRLAPGSRPSTLDRTPRPGGGGEWKGYKGDDILRLSKYLWETQAYWKRHSRRQRRRSRYHPRRDQRFHFRGERTVPPPRARSLRPVQERPPPRNRGPSNGPPLPAQHPLRPSRPAPPRTARAAISPARSALPRPTRPATRPARPIPPRSARPPNPPRTARPAPHITSPDPPRAARFAPSPER